MSVIITAETVVSRWFKTKNNFPFRGSALSIKIFTSEFNTFDVVLNTWLQKNDVLKTWLCFFNLPITICFEWLLVGT